MNSALHELKLKRLCHKLHQAKLLFFGEMNLSWSYEAEPGGLVAGFFGLGWR